MSLNYYKLYIKEVLDLSRTLVIKVEANAHIINKRLKMLYGDVFDENDKTTWKYYLNLAGKYHSTDKRIYVTSLDTLTEIEFNSDNLKIHKATAKAYQYNSRFYRELVTFYPEHENFILGALYPIDINKAIEAPDFTVIGYPDYLIEDNEVSLINNINIWINNFKERWFNQQFLLTDTNYLSAFLGVMFLQLPPLIISLRLKACKTEEVHTFHLREYLESNGGLHTYLSYMTRKQALFFYRNINYIERNAGKQEVFNWLIEKVLTDRRIPISEFNIHHDKEHIQDSLIPTAYFKKKSLNESVKHLENDLGFYSLAYILSKEEPLTKGNKDYRDIHEYTIKNTLEYTKNNYYKTKVLESAMYDFNDSLPITLQDVILNNWIYLSQKNIYNNHIVINNPINGISSTIPNKVGFILFLYAFCKAHEIKLNQIPRMIANRVPIDPVPTIDELKTILVDTYVPDTYLQFILDLHIPYTSYISVDDFKDWCIKHHDAANRQWFFISNHEHMLTRGFVHNAVSRLYQVAYIENELTGRTFESVIQEYNINLDGIKTEEWYEIYRSIYHQSTGQDIDTTEGMTNLQKAMLSLLKQLSSYSIQLLQDINKTSIKSINWTALRLGDVKYKGNSYFKIQIALMRLLSIKIKNRPQFLIKLNNLLKKFNIKNKFIFNIDIPNTDIIKKPKVNEKKLVDIGFLTIGNQLLCRLNNLNNKPLFKPYFDLSLDDKKKVKDIYTHYPTDDDYIPNVDITNIIRDLSIPVEPITPKLSILDSFKHYYLVKEYEEFFIPGLNIVLDGFYSNIATNYVNGFKLYKGFYKVNNFKLNNTLPESIELNGETYTGGIYFGPTFHIKRKDDLDIDLDEFIFYFDKQEFSYKTLFAEYVETYPMITFKDYILDFSFIYDQTMFDILGYEFKDIEMENYRVLISNTKLDNKVIINDVLLHETPSMYIPKGDLTYSEYRITLFDDMNFEFNNYKLDNIKHIFGKYSLDFTTNINSNINLDNFYFNKNNLNIDKNFTVSFYDIKLDNQFKSMNQSLDLIKIVFDKQILDEITYNLKP